MQDVCQREQHAQSVTTTTATARAAARPAPCGNIANQTSDTFTKSPHGDAVKGRRLGADGVQFPAPHNGKTAMQNKHAAECLMRGGNQNGNQFYLK